MSILYDLYASPSSEANEESTPRYHARVVNRQTLDPDTLVDRICERSTLGRGDILALFEELGHEMKQQLLAGNAVVLPNIGTFTLSLHAPADANPNTSRAEQIQVKRIEFRAESKLRTEIVQTATFERSANKIHSASLTNEEVNKLVDSYMKEHSFITRKTLSELCHLTKGTALNQIRRLVNEGILINSNTPHQPIYVLKK